MLAGGASLMARGMAQQPGTPDPHFFQNGRYIINKPGGALQTTFIDIFYVKDGGQLQYKVVTGGTVYENRVAVSGFIAEFINDLAPTGFVANLDFGFILGGGAYQDNGNIATLEKEGSPSSGVFVASYNAPKVLDENFGENGKIPLSTENEASYNALGKAKDAEGKSRIVATGTKKKDDAQWLIHNILYEDYGHNQNVFEVEGPFPVTDPILFPWENTLTAAGKSVDGILISRYDMTTETFVNKKFPETSIPGQTYEPLGLFGDGQFLYLNGYYYNSETDSHGSYIQVFNWNDLSNEPALTTQLTGFKPDPSSDMEDAYTSHLLRLNLTFPMPGMKSTNLDLDLYYVSGLMHFKETGRLTTFIACLNPDGTRRKEFGEDGYFLVDLETGNSPGGMVATEDGDLFLTVNAGENVCVYKIIGIKPSASTGLAEFNTTTLSIFPNPAADQLQVKIETRTSNSGILCLRNLAGQCLVKKQLALQAGVGSLTSLDINNIPAGIYFLTLETARELINQKVIVRKK